MATTPLSANGLRKVNQMANLDQAINHLGPKGRLMRLSPLMPWHFTDLFLVIGVRSIKKDWRSRAQIIDAINIQSGKPLAIEADCGFALTSFSRRL